MGKRETVRDVAKNLERLVHLIIARTHRHQTIEELALHSSIPVINALSDKFHPCQAMAFAMTVSEHVGDTKKLMLFLLETATTYAIHLWWSVHSLAIISRRHVPMDMSPTVQ